MKSALYARSPKQYYDVSVAKIVLRHGKVMNNVDSVTELEEKIADLNGQLENLQKTYVVTCADVVKLNDEKSLLGSRVAALRKAMEVEGSWSKFLAKAKEFGSSMGSLAAAVAAIIGIIVALTQISSFMDQRKKEQQIKVTRDLLTVAADLISKNEDSRRVASLLLTTFDTRVSIPLLVDRLAGPYGSTTGNEYLRDALLTIANSGPSLDHGREVIKELAKKMAGTTARQVQARVTRAADWSETIAWIEQIKFFGQELGTQSHGDIGSKLCDVWGQTTHQGVHQAIDQAVTDLELKNCG